MDQALYDQLSEARKNNALDPNDLRDFNTLEAGGAFKQFQQGAQPQGAPQAPNVITPSQAETPTTQLTPTSTTTTSTALPQIGDVTDFTNRPQTDLAPDQLPPFTTELSNRMGLPPLPRGEQGGDIQEPVRRLLLPDTSPAGQAYPVPRMVSRVGGALTDVGPALGGTLAHEAIGQTAGDATQHALKALETYLLYRTLGGPGIGPMSRRVIGAIPLVNRLLSAPQRLGGSQGGGPPPAGGGGAPPAGSLIPGGGTPSPYPPPFGGPTYH